ncbi:hypothetical protein ACP70R_047944 [Stipagrostis hirtigluma subsp. patula]
MADTERSEHGDRSDHHGRRSHFLVVAYGLQGHLNPARALARRLARVHGGDARVTLSVTVSGHGLMFPSLASPDEEVHDGLIAYLPHYDGFEVGKYPRTADELARSCRESVKSLSAIVDRFAVTGWPITSIVSAFSPPAMDVAAEHGIPLAVYWIQAATSFAVYYHYFHGFDQLVAAKMADPTHEVSLPGLRPLRIRDFPSFLVDATGSENGSVQWFFRSMFEHIGREKAKIPVNTFDELETTTLQALQQHVDVFTVGPMVPHGQSVDAIQDSPIHMYKKDEKNYMEWLAANSCRSVVYVSYGSMTKYSRQQVEEILQGLRECGRPYLWVVRKDGRDEEADQFLVENCSSEQGMILEWCDQLEVLSHSSVGCFVTHCGWNSTLEAITLGVPMVAVPNWSDQALNAHLVEEWGVGVRAEHNVERVIKGAELARCIEIVIGNGVKAMDIRERVNVLKDNAQKVVIGSGLIELNLQNFVKAMQSPM